MVRNTGKKIMKRVFIIFFLCYTHCGFLRFVSNDFQNALKGENRGEKETLYQIYGPGNSGGFNDLLCGTDRHAEQRMELHR